MPPSFAKKSPVNKPQNYRSIVIRGSTLVLVRRRIICGANFFALAITELRSKFHPHNNFILQRHFPHDKMKAVPTRKNLPHRKPCPHRTSRPRKKTSSTETSPQNKAKLNKNSRPTENVLYMRFSHIITCVIMLLHKKTTWKPPPQKQ